MFDNIFFGPTPIVGGNDRQALGHKVAIPDCLIV